MTVIKKNLLKSIIYAGIAHDGNIKKKKGEYIYLYIIYINLISVKY